MKRKRFTEEQIAFALRQVEAGTPVGKICRKMGVSEPSFYRWKKRFAGMGVPEIQRLRQFEEENKKLKQLVAVLTLDKTMLQDVLRGGRGPRPLAGYRPPLVKLRGPDRATYVLRQGLDGGRWQLVLFRSRRATDRAG
jgi:putative transposase